MARRVALATCSAFPDLDVDDRLLIDPLASRGIEVVPAVWDDPAVAWASFDLAVVRNTWDYPPRVGQFLAWAADVDAACGLHNPPEVLRWTTDKRYLGRLADAGVPVVPTTFLPPPDERAPADDAALPTEGGFVVKPTVSAGSRDTARYVAGRVVDGTADDVVAAEHVRRLRADGRTAMVQPYVDSVDTSGETALLFIDGQLSHAIRKGPLLEVGAPPTEDLFATEDIRPREPTAAQRAVAQAALCAAGQGPLLYARVDLLDTADGPVVLEIEMAEPSLFLATDAGAPDRLADAIAARVGR
jgi:glutathione synthase/RimK-type ligase-like ATP-grasp enzyme